MLCISHTKEPGWTIVLSLCSGNKNAELPTAARHSSWPWEELDQSFSFVGWRYLHGFAVFSHSASGYFDALFAQHRRNFVIA